MFESGSISVIIEDIDLIRNQAVEGRCSSDSNLDPGQTDQQQKMVAKILTYCILSKNRSVQLILYAEGPCKNASLY